ncbi:MAG: hypothetical protein FWC41_13840, partial [Firmicutes bacterium]|nr:hypothetical protein [Bacillota bacterium]
GTPEILFLNKKVSYDGNPSSFISSYLCRNFLPQLIVCENVPHNNNGHKCIKSKMYNELLNNIYTDTLYT